MTDLAILRPAQVAKTLRLATMMLVPRLTMANVIIRLVVVCYPLRAT